jgi:hypothetical protein
MDIWRALKIVGRRWYVSLTILLLCAAATTSLVARADAKYTAQAVITLLPPAVKLPADSEVEVIANPYMQTGLGHAATAVASAANSDVVADRLKAAGLGEVTFEVSTFEGSPILNISVESNDFVGTQQAVEVVLVTVEQVTRDLQLNAGSPETQLITSQVLAPTPGEPTESLATKTRVALGMGVATILAVMTSALVFDDLATRARRRRMSRREASNRAGALDSGDFAEANGHGADAADHVPVDRVNGYGTDGSVDLVPSSSDDGSTVTQVRTKSGPRRGLRSQAGR